MEPRRLLFGMGLEQTAQTETAIINSPKQSSRRAKLINSSQQINYDAQWLKVPPNIKTLWRTSAHLPSIRSTPTPDLRIPQKELEIYQDFAKKRWKDMTATMITVANFLMIATNKATINIHRRKR